MVEGELLAAVESELSAWWDEARVAVELEDGEDDSEEDEDEDDSDSDLAAVSVALRVPHWLSFLHLSWPSASSG